MRGIQSTMFWSLVFPTTFMPPTALVVVVVVVVVVAFTNIAHCDLAN